MKFTGAVIREQGVVFGILLVKSPPDQIASDVAKELKDGFRAALGLPEIPVVLGQPQTNGDVEFQGRSDLVNLLGSVFVEEIPWMEFDTAFLIVIGSSIALI